MTIYIKKNVIKKHIATSYFMFISEAVGNTWKIESSLPTDTLNSKCQGLFRYIKLQFKNILLPNNTNSYQKYFIGLLKYYRNESQ